ncbi:hypothetical protein [Catenovulum sediminis]|uniref:Uncharacterized protein n=1 Tax=Catenovulum sediminis TaxID=1740262 RepID=A0ABV1RCJ1_9ALTE|nr:hypothetical protein [Catenovulum sediminis]
MIANKNYPLLSMLLFLFSFQCCAINDPTLPDFSVLNSSASTYKTPTKTAEFKLQAISYMGNKYTAIINNKIYTEKQWLNSSTQLVKISQDGVILNQSGQTKKLQLRSVKIKTEPNNSQKRES